MAIPDGQLYSDGQLGAGTVSGLENAAINTEQAGADVGFGCGVVLKDGAVVPATKGHIFGVALKRNYTNADHLYDSDVQADKWSAGENLGVLRDGIIAVPVSADVSANENAAVDANGQFKPAGASDAVVGLFLSAANKGETARMQVRIQFANDAASGDASKAVDNSNVPNQGSGSQSSGK